MNVRSVLLILGVVVVGLLFVAGRTARGIVAIRGSGNTISEERVVSDFHAIDFSGVGKLTIVQGEREALTITADDNLLPYITSDVNNGTLTLAMKDSAWLPILRPMQPVHYTLHVKRLTRVEMSGAGELYAETLNADNLMVVQSGAGIITIDDLFATHLSVTMSGAGHVTVRGNVTTHTVQLSGLGSYQAGDLASQHAQVMLNGAGSVTVWAETDLDATLSGSGSVSYYGEPQIRTSATGIVNVHNLGMK